VRAFFAMLACSVLSVAAALSARSELDEARQVAAKAELQALIATARADSLEARFQHRSDEIDGRLTDVEGLALELQDGLPPGAHRERWRFGVEGEALEAPYRPTTGQR
jgi:hypothetical protein